MNRNYLIVAERARNRCEYCHAPEQVFNFAFEVEHIVPRSASGGDALENLALACESCNLYKASSIIAIDSVSGEDVSLFNPRQQAWEQHFHFDSVHRTVAGTTPSGRATVDRLKMNSDFQLRARLQWMVLNLYP